MYPIIRLPDDVAELTEQLGTKEKFWLNDKKFLYKIGRPETGENWAEIVCAQICEILGLPHSYYAFATWMDTKGVITPTFVPDSGTLYSGNELLAKFTTENYDIYKKYKQSQYTIGRVFSFLNNEVLNYPLGFQSPFSSHHASSCFLGYLMLDTLVANQDRHHENWGIIITKDIEAFLCPTFDHASSLGRNEQDNKRLTILSTKDMRQHITQYITKARTPFYINQTDTSTLTTIDSLEYFAVRLPTAFAYWLARLNALRQDSYENIFNKINMSWITEPSISFALKILELNTARINNLAKRIL